MSYSDTQLVAIASACSQLEARNNLEVYAFQELVEEYTRWLQRAQKLWAQNSQQQGELAALRDENSSLRVALDESNKNALLGKEAAALREKLEALQQELGLSYRSTAQVSQQLVQATQALTGVREDAERKGRRMGELEEAVDSLTVRAEYAEGQLRQRAEAVEVAADEAAARVREAEQLQEQVRQLEAENRMLIERWMELKMKEAERINEANAIYEDMVKQSRARSLEELARRQVDGVVRKSELDGAGGDGSFAARPAGAPTRAARTLRAHEGSCAALSLDHAGGQLATGGHDRMVKVWDTGSGALTAVLRGCLGEVTDLAMLADGGTALAACTDNKVYMWQVGTARLRHTMTGHSEKVVAVDVSPTGSSRAASAAYDRTIKVWDLERGFAVTTLACASITNSVCYTPEGSAICSGHADGALRMWDARTGRAAHEVAAAHAQAVTPDERHVAAGSADGAVHVWAESSRSVERTLRAHAAPVLACAWGGFGRPLVSADKGGTVTIWQ
eukprot:jgi/Mesen1/8830/ME000053S08245